MFRDTSDPVFSKRHIFHAFLLAFAAGSINVGAYLDVHRFVSHVTGFATLFGAAAVTGDWWQALGLLSVPVFFLTGSFIAGLLVDRPRHQGRPPKADLAFGLVAICLFAAAGLGHAGIFGSYGETLVLTQHYLLLALLCAASGVMNGMITSASNGLLRSSHLTGTTTDLGLGLARTLFPHPDNAQHKREVRANWLRLGIICYFVLGSALGAYAFTALGYVGFYLPAIIVLTEALYLALDRAQGARP